MRRADREITDAGRIDEIIRSCSCCRLGFADGGECYIVPLSFGFVHEDGPRVFYFHSAREGRKLDLARRCGRAGFELDCGHQLHAGQTPCQYSLGFQSVIGTGAVALVEDPVEKRLALRRILEQTAGPGDWDLPRGAEATVAVLRLTVEALSCKVHR